MKKILHAVLMFITLTCPLESNESEQSIQMVELSGMWSFRNQANGKWIGLRELHSDGKWYSKGKRTGSWEIKNKELLMRFAGSRFILKMNLPSKDNLMKGLNGSRQKVFALKIGQSDSDMMHAEFESTDGRKISANIVSRTDEQILVRSVPTNSEYVIPYSSLSAGCIQRIKNYMPEHMMVMSKFALQKSHHGEEASAIYDLAYALGISSSGQYDQGNYSVDLFGEVERQTRIYGKISYLMDLNDLKDMLRDKTEIPRYEQIICPGFPDNTFRLYTFPISSDYRQENGSDNPERLAGYNSIGIVTDRSDQVVAVQLNRTSDVIKYRHLVSNSYNSKHRVFDFLGSKKRVSEDARIRIESQEQGAIHIIESLYWISKYPENDYRNYCRLYMPKQFVNLLRYNILSSWVPKEDAAPKPKEVGPQKEKHNSAPF